MNKHFCNIGSKLASDLPDGKSYRHFMKNKVTQSIFLAPIEELEITSEITKLNIKKSPGYDKITPRLLKTCETYIRKPLTSIFNFSMEKCSFS